MRTSHSSLISVVLGKFGGLVGAGQTNRTTLISLCLINVRSPWDDFIFISVQVTN
jgi:hypothetical protein